MDLDNFFSFLQSSLDLPTLNEAYPLESDTLVAQPVPQPSSLSQSLTLLKAFCSDEDTVKSYLQSDEMNHRNNEGQQFRHSIIASCDTFNNPTNQSDNFLTIENTTPTPLVPPTTNYALAVKSHSQAMINDTYENLKSNFIFLAERGYKLTLSLNTDNNEVEEPWNPDVSRKILSVHFSSLNLRTELLSDDQNLNVFESLLMDEALTAFKGQKNLNLFSNLYDKSRAKASPDKLISICNRITGFRKIYSGDKIVLLTSIYTHLHAMDITINYDATIDGWDVPATDFKFDRRDTFIFNQFLHDGVVHVIETFPHRLRSDINVAILLYLIIIFNADSSELKYPEMIRHEQFSYIYLLRRYLRTICATDCEASDNLYRLMVKIEQLRFLDKHPKRKFLVRLNEPIMISIIKAIMGYVHY